KGRTWAQKAIYVAARILPAGVLSRLFFPNAAKSMDDTATILFTTGSSGDPKGVMLSHRNITANLEGIKQAFPLSGDDVILGALPLSHAFGLTATIWLPVSGRFKAVYHANPTEFETVANAIEEHGGTFNALIPSFLPKYIDRVSPDKLKSLKYVIAGAEK